MRTRQQSGPGLFDGVTQTAPHVGVDQPAYHEHIMAERAAKIKAIVTEHWRPDEIGYAEMNLLCRQRRPGVEMPEQEAALFWHEQYKRQRGCTGWCAGCSHRDDCPVAAVLADEGRRLNAAGIEAESAGVQVRWG